MNTLDTNHRVFLEHELGEALQERERIDGAIAYFRRRLGLPDDEAVAESGQSGGSNAALVGGDLMAMVNPGQYGGRSGVKAAADLLERVGSTRPLTTREIYDAITRGGVRVKDTDVLNKMMKRSGRFHRPVPGRWGLAEWYPASVRARGVADNDLPPDDIDSDSESEEPADSIGVQT